MIVDLGPFGISQDRGEVIIRSMVGGVDATRAFDARQAMHLAARILDAAIEADKAARRCGLDAEGGR